MKELNEDETPSPQAQTPAAKTSETATPVKAAPTSVQGSDDDAVLVEADQSSNQASPSGKKKKGKGKK
jgi:translocation protein SEC66